jgi:hypothetical protein
MLEQARTQASNGRTTWNGYLTTLERRFPDRWRRRDPAYGELADTFEGRIKAYMAGQAAATGEAPKLKAVE